MALNGDPWRWSVDEVVDALCVSTSWWTDARPNSSLPDPAGFEQTLREQEINGSTLLTSIDSQVLRDDLHIGSIGKRAAVNWAIGHLRSQSLQYMEHSRQTLHTAVSLTPSLLTPEQVVDTVDVHTCDSGSAAPDEKLTAKRSASSKEEQIPPHFAGEVNLSNDGTVGFHLRPGETLAEDSRGRKRRKVNLGTPLIDYESNGTFTNLEFPRGRSSQLTASLSKRPERVGNGDNENQKSKFGLPTLGTIRDKKQSTSSKFPVDDLFYHGLPNGSALDTDDDVDIEHYGEPPADVAGYVYNHIRHYLRAAERQEVILGNGQRATAIFPYRKASLCPNLGRSTTLLRLSDGKLCATMEDASRLSEIGAIGEKLEGDLALLAAKYADDVTVVPFYGDSGESEDGYSPSLLAELEAERREAEETERSKPRLLDTDEVARIVDEKVKETRGLWEARKRPVKERDAFRIWRQGKREDERAKRVAAAEKQAQHFETRLKSLREAILMESWTNAGDVRRQCVILDESIAQKEEAQWRISVLQRKTEPPRKPVIQRLPKRPPRIRSRMSDDGESVNSDSEADFDQVEDFVENSWANEAASDITLPDASLSLPSQHAERTAIPGQETADMVQGKDLECEAEADGTMDLDKRGTLNDSDTTKDATGDTSLHRSNDAKDLDPKDPSVQASPIRTARQEISASGPVIDLTYSSEDSDTGSGKLKSPIPAPALLSSQDRTITFGSNPEGASSNEIHSWAWTELEKRSDRKRLILKILCSPIISNETYREMRTRILYQTFQSFKQDIVQVLATLAVGHGRPKGMTPDDYTTFCRFVRLLICWGQCKKRFLNAEAGILRPMVTKLRSDLVSDKICRKDFEKFYQFVKEIIGKRETPGLAEVIQPAKEENKHLGSTLPVEIGPEKSAKPERNRVGKNKETKKKRFPINLEAFEARKNAIQRQKAQQEREMEIAQRTGSQTTDGAGRILINTLKEDPQDAVYIDPLIAGVIKPHQIEGVRFMWREIVEAGQSDPQGCLLAHTMGLGKTMQTITFLIAISGAARSSAQNIKNQLPESLRVPESMHFARYLVLCPASLVVNWVNEIKQWTKSLAARENLGPTRSIDATTTPEERIITIAEWYDHGGMLVMSYNLLLHFLSPDTARQSLPESERRQATTHLVEGPSVIIADEAHSFRNAASKTREAVMRFRSKSRIALTGSPLSNNLDEYWSIIDWLSPGYLGNAAEFRDHYVHPIQAGSYLDSSNTDIRLAKKKLAVLKQDIEPKTNRADITVLKNVLKSKTEFLIVVPLTDLQHQMYSACIKHIDLSSQHGSNVSANASLWKWISVLGQICNHPRASYVQLQSAAQKRKNGAVGNSNKETASGEDDIVELHEDEEDELPHESRDVLNVVEELLRRHGDISSPDLSYKTALFLQILGYTRSLGDKVLAFSHRLPTLDYLESVLKQHRVKYARLDGATPMKLRPAMMKSFNNGAYDVLLISTTAGGLGINLTGANRVIIFDAGFNPQHEEQAIGRAYRLGQQKDVFVYRILIGGTLEPTLWKQNVFKMQLASKVVDTKNPQRFADKLREYLFLPKKVYQEDLTESLGKDKHVLDRILAGQGEDTYIRSITTTETLMREADEGELTAEELREIREEHRLLALRRTDPEAYRRHRENQQAQLFRQSAAAMASAATMAAGGSSMTFPNQQTLIERIANIPDQVFGSLPSTSQASYLAPRPEQFAPRPDQILALNIRANVPPTQPTGPRSSAPPDRSVSPPVSEQGPETSAPPHPNGGTATHAQSHPFVPVLPTSIESVTEEVKESTDSDTGQQTRGPEASSAQGGTRVIDMSGSQDDDVSASRLEGDNEGGGGEPTAGGQQSPRKGVWQGLREGFFRSVGGTGGQGGGET